MAFLEMSILVALVYLLLVCVHILEPRGHFFLHIL